MSHVKIRHLVLCIALPPLVALLPVSARAQNPAPVVVRIAPASVQVGAGETVDVAVEAVDVQELYGFDVTVTFDPQVVEVVDADPNLPDIQVALGQFLEAGFAVINTADNTAGSAHLVMTQLNPSLPKSGTGALIVIKLRGKRAGTSSPLTVVNPQLARRDGYMIPASGAAGQVTVVSAAGPTSTPMPTQGAGTPMAPVTPEPTMVAPTAEPTTVPATATAVAGVPAVAPTTVPTATATTVPTRTPAPAASATATAVPASLTPPPPSPTAASVASPTVALAALPSVTPGPAAKSTAPAPTSAGESPTASATPGEARRSSWIPVGEGLLAAGVVALALWLLRRRSASR
jgi:hypothetical protein